LLFHRGNKRQAGYRPVSAYVLVGKSSARLKNETFWVIAVRSRYGRTIKLIKKKNEDQTIANGLMRLMLGEGHILFKRMAQLAHGQAVIKPFSA